MTISESVAALDAQLFVGREQQVAMFEAWLASSEPTAAILNVSGAGGMGKSTLLGEFARRAKAHGRAVRRVDGYAISPEPESLLAALTGAGSVERGLEVLNAEASVILIDTFEALTGLNQFFQDDFVPRLEHGAKVVVSGRTPLGRSWSGTIPWHRHVEHIALTPLSAEAVRSYLERRGIVDVDLVAQVSAATRGQPLAVSLAADLIDEFGVVRFDAAPGWELTVHGLVERLLRDVQTHLRELLEAAAVVRHFDEATLAAILGTDDLAVAFDQLCRLSMVREGERGLMLHDSVRFLLSRDLRWRNPERWRALTSRSMEHHRERAQRVKGDEREWLVAEQLYLWGDTVGHLFLYGSEEAPAVSVVPGSRDDADELVELWRVWLTEVMADETPMVFDEYGLEAACGFARLLITHPDTRLRVALDETGRLRGLTTVMPITQSTYPLIAPHPIVGPLTRAYVTDSAVADLSPDAQDATIFQIMQLAYGADDADRIRGALVRDLIGVFSRNGVYLVVLPFPSWKPVFESLGFRPVDEARHSVWTGDLPTDGYVLDLTRIGVDGWIEAITSGRDVPWGLRQADVERLLHDVLLGWADDAAVSRSALVAFLGLPADGEQGRANALRDAILTAFSRARSLAGPDMELALRAVDGAYLHKTISHDRLADKLHVSRTTFYRLLQRGVRRVAEQLTSPSPMPPG